MLQPLLAGLLAAGMMTSIVVLNGVVSPERALGRLTPVVVGTLDLHTSPSESTFAVSNMAPGDRVARALTITNGGTLPLRYAMRGVVPGEDSALTARLEIVIREAAEGTCADTGGRLVAGPARPAELAFGSRAWGRQDGDRQLEAGASEVLCFFVHLPISTTNAASGAGTALSLTFDAEEIRSE